MNRAVINRAKRDGTRILGAQTHNNEGRTGIKRTMGERRSRRSLDNEEIIYLATTSDPNKQRRLHLKQREDNR